MMAIHKLTPRGVDTAKFGKHEDGGGLRLVVSKTGAKKWVFRFTVNGKRREMGLGSISETDLGDARDLARIYRKKAKKGIDPIEYREQEEEAKQREATTAPTFTSVAAKFILAHRRGWKNKKHRFQWTATLKTYARPVIGEKPVDQISTEDILKILSSIWTTKTETAKRVQGRIENVLDFASAHQYRDQMNPARWRGHLDKLLPKPSKVSTVKHHPAMPFDKLPAFWVELSEKSSVSASALQLLILTATRTSEVLNATWDEIDFDKSVWTIPVERMKSKRKHQIPLSEAALDVLKSLPRMADNPYVFPGEQDYKPLSNMALLQLMRKAGYGVKGKRGSYVPHGFRSSFRDWSGEVSSFPRDVCEMALAHSIQDKTEAAYRRGSLFTKRRKMMDEWSDYVTTRPAEVVQMHDTKEGAI